MQRDHLDSDAGEARSVARIEAGGVRLIGLGALPPAVVYLDDAIGGADAEHGEEHEKGDAVDVGRLTTLEECKHSFHLNLKGSAVQINLFILLVISFSTYLKVVDVHS